MVDREAHPGKTFDMTPEATADRQGLPAIYRHRFSTKMPVIQIMEVGPQDADQREALSQLSSPPDVLERCQPSGWIIDPPKTVWTNARFGATPTAPSSAS